MAFNRTDIRTKTPIKPGEPNVSYPYGSFAFPKIVSAYTGLKGSQSLQIPFLTPYKDFAAYPNCLLTEYSRDPGDDTDTNILATYETLPGPWFVEVTNFQDTGIPTLTARRKVAANDDLQEGELIPGNPLLVTAISTGNPCTVTLFSPHYLDVGQVVSFSGTNSTPSLNGKRVVTGIPSPYRVQISGINITGAGTAGTMIRVNQITAISTGSPCTITFQNPHDLPPRCWVNLSGTDSTPTINGPQWIKSVPAPNQITIENNVVTGAGTFGTMLEINRRIRELKTTANLNILMEVESMAAVPDVTIYNQDDTPGHQPSIGAWKEYSFPDFLIAINGYRDNATSNTIGSTQYGLSFTGDGSFGVLVQNGYRGPCVARRLRFFSDGPIPDAVIASFTPFFIMPSSGTVVIESQSESIQDSTGGVASATSFYYKAGRIQPVLTGAGAIGNIVGSGQARFFVDLPPSTPTMLTQGQIIPLLEQPQKMGIALWQLYVWQVVVPYTSGLGPNGRAYTFTGNNGIGNITVTGLKATDNIVQVRGISNPGDYTSFFTSPIATNDTLHQSGAVDLSAQTFSIEVTGV